MLIRYRFRPKIGGAVCYHGEHEYLLKDGATFTVIKELKRGPRERRWSTYTAISEDGEVVVFGAYPEEVEKLC